MNLSELKLIADIANLYLTEEELSRLCIEFDKTLGLLSKMQDVNPGALPAYTEKPGEAQRLRRDVPAAGLDPKVLLESAPELEGRLIVIPNVL